MKRDNEIQYRRKLVQTQKASIECVECRIVIMGVSICLFREKGRKLIDVKYQTDDENIETWKRIKEE